MVCWSSVLLHWLSVLYDTMAEQANDDKMQNGLYDENTFKDGGWMFSDGDDCSHLQKTTQDISEILEKLEKEVQEGYKDLNDKISELGKEDAIGTQKLFEDFKSRWNAKYRETENLRLSLKRATHESIRVNDNYHEMEENISKMRKQFGQAIDSSVTEIEELSLCNSTLSQRICELETKIMRGDRAFKKNSQENLNSLQKVIEFCSADDVTIQVVKKRLEREADKIERMIIVEDLFAVTDDNKKGGESLAEKSLKMVDSVAKGLVETLKRELEESRNIAESQRKRIKKLEKEKEDFLEDQLNVKNEGVLEMNELFERLRRSLLNRTPKGTNESNLKVIDRNFSNIKKLVRNVTDGLDKSYKSSTSKTNEISELKETVKELEDDIRTHAVSIEELNEEKQFLKTKIEHSESQHRLTNDELHAVQKRLTAAEDERKVFFEENVDLKGGKENMKDYCSNLSGQNDTLLTKLQTIQEERDRLFNDLQDHMHRLGESTLENNELESKIETLENAVTKLRREYQNQTREFNISMRENEELRHSLQDSEQDRMKIKRSLKSVETGNKDLEDQIFQLTNTLQKLKIDKDKMRTCQEEQQETIDELRVSINTGESEKTAVEQKLKEISKQQKELQDTNKSLSSDIKRDKTLNEKEKKLLSLYEKLLMKLLHQRKELLIFAKVKDDSIMDVHLCTSQSIDFKNVSEIEEGINLNTQEIDHSFTTLSASINCRTGVIYRYETFIKDLLEHTKQFSKTDETDSCYSTSDDFTEPRVTRVSGLRGLSALKVKKPTTDVELSKETLCELSEIIKMALLSRDKNIVDSKKPINNCKSPAKKIKHLQTKLRNRKILQRNLQNKLSEMKKEIKVLKGFHRAFHSKTNLEQAQQNTNARSPSARSSQSPRAIKTLDLISDLKAAQNELNSLRQYIQTLENREKQIDNSLDTVDSQLSNLHEKLTLRVACSLCEKKTESSVDQLEEKVSKISEQREYMLDHMKFTNKRLEVLLNCLKGKDEKIGEAINSSDKQADDSLNMRPLLRRVRKSFDDDKNAMKKAVSILELTKAISINDLTELDADLAISDEQRDVIVLVKDMNENMETVLREARSKITDARVLKREGKATSESSVSTIHETMSPIKPNVELVPKSELLKKENELKSSLENAQQRLDDLSQFLEKREAEIKERDEIIAKLNKEYVLLKTQSTDEADDRISTRDRMIEAYRKTKEKLEKENEFLQIVVKELRQELLNFQSSYKKEEETQQRLQEFINELQICKSSLEKSLDKVAYELNIVKTDRDHLIQSMNQMHPIPSAAYWYNGGGSYIMHNGGVSNYGNGFQDDHCYGDCNMCNYQEFSESTTVPFSEEDWASLCDDCDSLQSEGEDVVSSSESQSTTTSSRIAKTIKTEEATEVIKSKNRPKKYLVKETRTRKQILSPKPSHRSNNNDPFEDISFVNTDRRVQGRRKQDNQPHEKFRHSFSGRRSSLESPSSGHRRSPRPGSRSSSSRPDSGQYETIGSNQQPISNIDDAINNAAHAQTTYYEEPGLSPRDQLAGPFLNRNFEKKKKKKNIFAFGKK